MRNIFFGAVIPPSLNPGLIKFRLKYPGSCAKAIFDYKAPAACRQNCKNILTDVVSKQAPITARWSENSVQFENGMRLALESPELMAVYQELGRKGFQPSNKECPISQKLSEPYVWIPNITPDQPRQEFLEDIHELINSKGSRELVINGLYMYHKRAPHYHKSRLPLDRGDPREDYTFFMFESKGSRPFAVRRIIPAGPALPVVDQRVHQPTSAPRVHLDAQHRPEENRHLVRKLYTPETAPGGRSVSGVSGHRQE